MTGYASAGPLAAQPDRRLVELVGEGSERAFEAVVRRYRPALLRYCTRIGLAEAPAEDVVQRSLTNAWLALARGTPVRDLKPWLYRIVHNQAISALRRGRRQPVKLSEAVDHSLHYAPETRLAAREALGQVAALPEMQRDALLLTAIEGRSHEEAATVLGVSDGAIRGLIHRARVTLRSPAALFPPGLHAWLSRDSEAGPVLEGSASLQGGGRLVGMAAVLAKGVALAATTGLLLGGRAEVGTRSLRVPGARVPAIAQARAQPPPAGDSRFRNVPAPLPTLRPGLQRVRSPRAGAGQAGTPRRPEHAPAQPASSATSFTDAQHAGGEARFGRDRSSTPRGREAFAELPHTVHPGPSRRLGWRRASRQTGHRETPGLGRVDDRNQRHDRPLGRARRETPARARAHQRH